MAIHNPFLSTSGNTTARLADRVVGLAKTTLSPTAKTSSTTADGQSQPPTGFNAPVPDSITNKIPDRATPGSVTSSNNDRQAAVNDQLGLVDRASVIDALLGRGGDPGNGGGDPLSDLSGSDPTRMPGIDQGFGLSPDNAALAAAAAEVIANPMHPFQGGSVGGPLGTTADTSQSQGPRGIAFQGKGAISSGTADALSQAIAEVEAEQAAKRKAEEEKAKADQSITTAKGAKISPDGEVQADQGMADTAINTIKSILSFFGFNPSSKEINEGVKNATGIGANRNGHEFLEPDAGVPSEEQNNKSRAHGLALTSTLLDQLQAAQTGKPTGQGGSGDATPVDDGGIAGEARVGSIATNQASIDGRNLFGQPGGPGSENSSGGIKNSNGFTKPNGGGVTDPGPEGGNPQGDARFQDDPGAAIGGRQSSPDLSRGNGSTPASGGNTGTAAADVLTGTSRADTLRGFGGNDTLRGLAGNDILDGGAGRDQLTGGAGADQFRFSAGSGFGQANADRITDFTRAEGDHLAISRQAFGLAAGTSVSFQSVNNDQALNQALASGNLFVHDQRNGSLLFNQNGAASGVGSGGVFAILATGTALQASDLALIA